MKRRRQVDVSIVMQFMLLNNDHSYELTLVEEGTGSVIGSSNWMIWLFGDLEGKPEGDVEGLLVGSVVTGLIVGRLVGLCSISMVF